MIITKTFEEIKDAAAYTKRCKKCNSLITKTISAYQTLNPYNRHNGVEKTISQIRKENLVKIDEQSKEWKRQKELCSKCRKDQIPDVKYNFVTKEEWDETKNLREEAESLMKNALKIEKNINDKLKGRHLEIKHKGKNRIGQITNFSMYHGTQQLQYDIVRVDGKGVTEVSDYNDADSIFK